MDMFLIFDNLLSLLLGYYWLGLWKALKLMIIIRGESWGGRIKIGTGKRLKNFQKLIIGGRTII